MGLALTRETSISPELVQEIGSDGRVRVDVHPGGMPVIIKAKDPRLAEDLDEFAGWRARTSSIRWLPSMAPCCSAECR
jgi:hypothetical protein